MTLNPVRTFLRKPPPKMAEGDRVYAIGDIHGHAGLLAELLREIERDKAQRPSARVRIVILGDVIDHGPDTAKLLEVCLPAVGENFIVLKGNHEQLMVAAYQGDVEAMDIWLSVGGAQTLQSFGVPRSAITRLDLVATLNAMRSVVQQDLINWLDRLPTSIRIGDYFFCHAGVRPKVPLSDQADRDLLWIRDEFTQSTRFHGAVVVHGHTICERGVDIRPNRIAVDTGAHRTGILSAVALEGDQKWAISTRHQTALAA